MKYKIVFTRDFGKLGNGHTETIPFLSSSRKKAREHISEVKIPSRTIHRALFHFNRKKKAWIECNTAA